MFPEDINGIAQHILRLIDVYNLTINDISNGILGDKITEVTKELKFEIFPARRISIGECYILVDVAYASLMHQEFVDWSEKCLKVNKLCHLTFGKGIWLNLVWVGISTKETQNTEKRWKREFSA